MKILRLISSVDPKCGGPAGGIRQITPALARLRHTADVVTLDDPAGADGLRLCTPPRPLAARQRFPL